MLNDVSCISAAAPSSRQMKPRHRSVHRLRPLQQEGHGHQTERSSPASLVFTRQGQASPRTSRVSLLNLNATFYAFSDDDQAARTLSTTNWRVFEAEVALAADDSNKQEEHSSKGISIYRRSSQRLEALWASTGQALPSFISLDRATAGSWPTSQGGRCNRGPAEGEDSWFGGGARHFCDTIGGA